MASTGFVGMPSTETPPSDFVQAVLESIRLMYPEEVADKSWDNTGLLLESIPRPDLKRTVCLCNDLTTAVADRAIREKASIIVTYHPIIFSGLKSLTLANSQQASLLRLASAGVTVYSPHSAADAVPGGLNDWLADVLLGNRLVQTKRDLVAYARSASEQREWIRPLPEERLPESLLRSPNGALGAGYGRIVRLGEPGVSLADLMRRLGQRVRDSILVGSEVVRPWVRSIGTDVLLALPPHLQAATDPPVYEPNTVPFAKLYNSVKIRSFAVCVGSGWDVLREARGVDLLVTGEMSHHAALAATERGQIVLATLHSNSERGFISDRMAPILMNLLKEKGFVFGREKQNTEPHLYAEVIVCQESDPFQIVRTEDL